MYVVVTYALSAVLLFATLYVVGRDLGATFSSVSATSDEVRSRLELRAGTRISGLDRETAQVLSTTTVQMMVSNDGEVPLGSFADWDVIAELQGPALLELVELDYVDGQTPAPGQWTVRAIYSDSSVLAGEYLEPGVLNPGEQMSVLLDVGAPVASSTRGRVTFVTSNGTTMKTVFRPAFQSFFHSETQPVGPATYYQLTKSNPAGPPATLSAVIAPEQAGPVRPDPMQGRFVYSLAGVDELPQSVWGLTYRLRRDKADFGFIWYTDATDVSLGATGSWEEIDLAPIVPAGATGAILEVVNSGAQSQLSGLVRGTEDTRDYMAVADYHQIGPSGHRWQAVKLDSDRRVLGYVEDPDIDFKLIGYTLGSDPTYFATPPEVGPSAVDVWTTIDLAAYVGPDSDGALLLLESRTDQPISYGVREVGSTFSDTARSMPAHGNSMYAVGLDALKRFQVYTSDLALKVYLIAETKGSVVYYTEDIAVADPAPGLWVSRDADGYGVPLEAGGLFLRVDNTEGAGSRGLGLRRAGSTDDWNRDVSADARTMGAVGIDNDNLWLEFMEDPAVDVSIAAYTRGVRMDVHAHVDALIRQSDGSVRTVLATHVAESLGVTGDAWQTFSGGYPFPGYTVVTPTDYLEVDLFADATVNASSEPVSVEFLVDDPGLPALDQAQLQEGY